MQIRAIDVKWVQEIEVGMSPSMSSSWTPPATFKGIITPAAERTILKEGQRWFVARTRPHRDRGVSLQLDAQNFTHFRPEILKTVRHARKFKTVRASLFPGYLFVALDLARERWRSVNGTFGVAGMIMDGDYPRPVPNGVVESIVAHVDARGLLRTDDGLRLGLRVQMTLGPFANSFGAIDRLDDKGRVRVLLEIMGGHVPVLAERSSVKAVA